MDTGVMVAIVTSGLALLGLAVKSWNDRRIALRAADVEADKGAVDGYKWLTGDAMARIAQLQAHITKVEADNEALRCRVLDLEKKVSEMALNFALERADWQRNDRKLREIARRVGV